MKDDAQKPVGVAVQAYGRRGATYAVFSTEVVPPWTKLYAAPVAAQKPALSDSQLYGLLHEHLGLNQRQDDTVIDPMTGRFTDVQRYRDFVAGVFKAARGEE